MYDFIENKTGLKRVKGKETTTFDYEIDSEGNISITAQIAENMADIIKEKYIDVLVGAGFILLFILNTRFAYLLAQALIYLDVSLIQQNIYTVTLILTYSVLMWIASTALTYYNYHNRKRRLLILVISTFILRGWAWIFTVLYNFFIPYIEKVEITELMTPMKVAGLGWLSTTFPSTVLVIWFCYSFFTSLYQERNLKAIAQFKIKRYLRNKDNPLDYDLKIVKDIKTGKIITVLEHDRYLHGNTLGATGTGKTSSTLLQQVNNDLNTKMLNEDRLKRALTKMVKAGRAYIEKPFSDKDFSLEYFKPNPGYEKEFEKITSKYRSAGITVMAPDSGFPDDVYKLAKAKGFSKVNRIDTSRAEDGSIKEGSIGSNPLFISEHIPKHSLIKTIVQRATLAADVMQIMFEMSGAKGDPYFASINRIATTTVAMVLMLTYPRRNNGKQPSLGHVRDIINRFDYLNEYLPELQKVNDEYKGAFQFIIDIVTNEFLGDGRETFEKHSKGLKVQFNNFLTDPDIARVLCAEESIDLDRMLAEGQITVVNFDQGGLGPINSPAFGIFFSVSFINAILRRPGSEWTRLPHFWLIDEFPVIVNPHFEACFSQFRKFRVGMSIAVQTLDQMNKNPFLEYLRGIILNSCGYHIVFGRTNINDQDTYSQLSGVVDKVVKMDGVSRTALSSETPQYVMTERYSTEQVEHTSAHDLRNKDFQEVTFFRVHKGEQIPPVHGRVDFLRERDWKKKRRYKVDWIALMQEQEIVKKYKAAANGNNREYDPAAELPVNELNTVSGPITSEVAVTYSDKNDNNISPKDIISAGEADIENTESQVVLNIKEDAQVHVHETKEDPTDKPVVQPADGKIPEADNGEEKVEEPEEKTIFNIKTDKL